MMITNGCDVRTVASYLGYASVSMTLDIYADVDPVAKMAAIDKVLESFDVESSFLDGFIDWKMPAKEREEGSTLVFTAQQLRVMLAEAERREAVMAAASIRAHATAQGNACAPTTEPAMERRGIDVRLCRR